MKTSNLVAVLASVVLCGTVYAADNDACVESVNVTKGDTAPCSGVLNPYLTQRRLLEALKNEKVYLGTINDMDVLAHDTEQGIKDITEKPVWLRWEFWAAVGGVAVVSAVVFFAAGYLVGGDRESLSVFYPVNRTTMASPANYIATRRGAMVLQW